MRDIRAGAYISACLSNSLFLTSSLTHSTLYTESITKSTTPIIIMSDRVDQDQPLGEGISDNDYKSRPGQSEIPVDSDERAEPATGILEGEVDPKADSDAQLGTST
jgi:hypothetical protein